ncbi:MAG: hypothetical protein ABEJ36_00170 [Candidatus Nanosalina sp.]
MAEENQVIDEERRNLLRGVGIIGGLSVGVTGGLGGFLSAVFAGDALTKPAYWNNEPINTAYEPAIEHAAETGELDIKTVQLGYDLYDTDAGEFDENRYEKGVEELMEELPGLEEVSVSYDFMEPENHDWIPDDSSDLVDYQFGDRREGLYSLMEAAGHNLRDEEHQLVNLITSSGKIFEAGGTHPEIEGVAYIQDGRDLKTQIETSAHEDAHLLGVGHTLADGMTNVPFGEIYADQTENFFGPKSRGWWEGIMENYEEK